MPNQKDRDFKAVPATACWGIENCKDLFGLGTDKSAISAVFDEGSTGDSTKTTFFRQQRNCIADAQPLERDA